MRTVVVRTAHVIALMASLAGASAAVAGECRTVSGETFTSAQPATPFTMAVKGCAASPAPRPTSRGGLSPLLQLYDAPGASVDVRPKAAVRGVARTVVIVPRNRGREAAVRPPIGRRTSAPPRVVRAGRPGPYTRASVSNGAVLAVARAYDIDPAFLAAVVNQESRGRADALSPKGARGPMQLMPGTAARYGVRGAALGDPVVNLAVGAVHLKALQRRYGNNLPLILAAYNAGEGAVERRGRHVPPFRETRGYVGGILDSYGRLIAHPAAFAMR